jgi:hypothetical protein
MSKPPPAVIGKSVVHIKFPTDVIETATLVGADDPSTDTSSVRIEAY